jgi:hypothetical protein
MNWTTQQSNTLQTLNEVFFLSLNTGWAVGDLGTITHYNVAVTNIETKENSLISYRLFQNYPNPFNPSTTIRFSVLESSFINLSIFNSLGEKIEELVNEVMEQGMHTIEFYAEDLSSGTYFYKIQTPNFTQTKKIILLK